MVEEIKSLAKNITRAQLSRILLIVGVVSLFFFGLQAFFSVSADASYESAAELAFSAQTRRDKLTLPTEPPEPNTWIPAPVEEEDPNMDVIRKVNLTALREVNPDIIGWILVPETRINYPIMYAEDNDYYLNHTWEKEANAVGSIFLECRNSTDLTDYNTIIYGHNRTDGSMFADLRKFSADWNYQRSPYVYIVTDDGVFRYEIFSSYQAPVDSFTYGLSFNEGKTRANFLIQSKEASRVNTDVYPEINDRILTLSTCSGAGYGNRWVVQARLKMMLVE